jgi:hypothetical protein
MIASVLIIGISAVLLVYWFRYTCLLVLQTQTSEGYVKQMVAANRLSFVSVRQALSADSDVALDPLRRALENDYRILTFLLNHAAGIGSASIEDRMLLLDYKMMRLWYQLTRHVFPPQARKAVVEMAGIVGYFANHLGEHLAVQSSRS